MRALVLYPDSESYTVQALQAAFAAVLPGWTVHYDNTQVGSVDYDLVYSDYDEIDWDRQPSRTTLVNAYRTRKALIRKNYLCTTISHYVAKHPNSILATSVPKTYPFEIAHADELEELLCDELYDLRKSFDDARLSMPIWILKPAMADKGQGIRLFDTLEGLQEILESFEEESDDEEEQDNEDTVSTKVSLSSMRDWVVQEYINPPLLIDLSNQSAQPGVSTKAQGYKFHLRVYTLAVGALQVYISTEILALFATKAYRALQNDTDDGTSQGTNLDKMADLSAHLTNTCLQTEEEAGQSVFLFSDLIGKDYLSADGHVLGTVREPQVERAIDDIGQVIGETFRAGLGMPAHFAVDPNAFEVFGIDILLSTSSDSANNNFNVHLLEVNACPDFKQSGSSLHEVIQGLFKGVMRIAVQPFFPDEVENSREDALNTKGAATEWEVGQRRGSWLKCADEAVLRKPTPF